MRRAFFKSSLISAVFLSLLLALCAPLAAQQINLQTQVKGLLPPANGGTGFDTSSSNGCPKVTAGIWSFSAANCSSGGSAAGGNYAIQYSNGGVFAGANFTGIVKNNASSQPPTAATYSDIVPLFGSGPTDCYLRSDGNCAIPASGATPAGTNALQASNGAGTALMVATPNIANAALGKSNGLIANGDSILTTGTTSTGPGNTALQQTYDYLWQQTIGGPFLAAGAPGDQEEDNNYKWVYRVENPQGNGLDPLYGHELGTNDAIYYGANTNQQQIFQRVALATLAWLGTPQAYKTFGQNCTLGGGMAASSIALLSGMAVQASTNGATASCVTHANVANGPIYACYLIQDGNGGTFTLSLDATAQTDPFNGTTTWDAFGDGGASIATHNGVTSAVACARFTGTWAANSSHTILFTVNSSTSATNVVWPLWVGSAAPPSATLNPNVVVISPNMQNTSSAGAPYVATYQGFLQNIVSELVADGENLVYSNTSAALLAAAGGNTTTMFANYYADAVHPNNSGHAIMATTAEGSSPTSTLLAVSHWNPQQPGQNYIPGPVLSPYQWFSVNPYNITCGTGVWCPGLSLGGSNGQIFGITTNTNTGMTFIAPNGGTGFSFCYSSLGGLIANGPPPISQCFMTTVNGDLVNFFQGSTAATGMSIQGSQLTTGTAFKILSQGTLEVTGLTNKNGVYSTQTATSGVNYPSPCWNYLGAVYNALLGVPGIDGPCWQFEPITPTPAGQTPTGYMTLQHSNTVGAVGLDLRNAGLLSHLAAADVTAIGGTGTATFALGSSTVVGTGATTPTCSSTTCDSVSGVVNFTTGTGPSASGAALTVTLPVTRAAVFPCTASMNIVGATAPTISCSGATNTITISTGTLPASTSINFTYVAHGN